MSDQVRGVQYAYVKVKNRTGVGAEALGALKKAKINMLAFSGFPLKGGEAQLDFVTENISKLKKVARKNQWKLSPVKKAFLVTGSDRVGAVWSTMDKLQKAKISVTAAEAISVGKGRYGVIVWVKPAAYQKAAKVLGAK